MWPALSAAMALAASPAETDAALARVNGRAPAMGYVFVLDTSEPEKALADSLRPEIAAFVEALPKGDSLEVIAFHVRPFVALERTVITEANRTSLATTLRTLELPSGYDHDLGAGLATLADELNAPGSPPYTHVFGISSFCHAPSVLSPWSSGGRGCGPIRDVTRIGAKVAALRERGALSLHWFPVRGKDGIVDMSGAAAAMHELGGELVTDAPGAWLANFRARLPATRPLPPATHDAAAPAFTLALAAPADEEGNARLSVRASTEVLDLVLTDIQLSGAHATAASVLQLDPEAVLPVTLEPPPPPFSFFPRSDVVNVTIELSAGVELAPRPAVSLWGLRAPPSPVRASLIVPVTRSYGLSPMASAATALLGLASIAAATLALRARLVPLKLGGVVTVRHRGGARVVLPASDLSEAAIVLGDDGAARLGRPEEAAIILTVHRSALKVYATVRVRAKDVEINGRPAAPASHPIVPGATSFRVGEWRVTWE